MSNREVSVSPAMRSLLWFLFVRGLTPYAPPGPAPVWDGGNAIPYVELAPNTGAWVLQLDFPGSKLVLPASLGPCGFEQYSPGSEIWVWHGDLIPEPYDPPAEGYVSRT